MRKAVVRNWIQENRQMLILLSISLIWCAFSYASTNGGGSSGNDAAFNNGYNWFTSVIHGKLGTLLAGVAFLIGLILGIVKQAPMMVLGGVVFALLIAFGPDMATGIVNSSKVI